MELPLKRPSHKRIAKIRGCVRGVSSEFVLACDMRFASRENTLLGQPEVGVGVHPGGGGTERLPHLVGRARALEIVLGANRSEERRVGKECRSRWSPYH